MKKKILIIVSVVVIIFIGLIVRARIANAPTKKIITFEKPTDYKEIIDNSVEPNTFQQTTSNNTTPVNVVKGDENTNNQVQRDENSSHENVSNNEFNCKESIRNYVRAEDNRDFNTLISLLSSNMIKYWHIDYPTISQLEKTYQSSWNKISQSENEINSIEKVNENTYDMNNSFTYTGRNTGETKTISSTIRFQFDNNGKINYINEMRR
jgi:hypothetical protein